MTSTEKQLIESVKKALYEESRKYSTAQERNLISIFQQAITEERERMREKIMSMSLKSENSIDKLPEDSEQNRVTNLLNENMVIGYQVALSDLLSSLDKPLQEDKQL